MLCFIWLDIAPCKNNVLSQSTIWSVVPALITGVKSNFVPLLMVPFTIELMKFTRASLVLVLKMANSGPFDVVPAIGFVGGKKLNTLPELNRLCDKLLLQPVKPVPSVVAWNARAMLASITTGSRNLPSLASAVVAESPRGASPAQQ